MISISKRRQNEDADSFRNVYRYRAGIEATMSQFDRLTEVKHLRVRGLKAVSCAATLKALGLNIFRGARFHIRSKSGFSGIRKAGVPIIAVYIEILRFILNGTNENWANSHRMALGLKKQSVGDISFVPLLTNHTMSHTQGDLKSNSLKRVITIGSLK